MRMFFAMMATVVCAAAAGSVPAGFDAQCRKQLWVTYRSFKKELERTGQFAAMGITNRCFFAANTINALCEPYCEYPLIWKGFKKYDWSALDAQAEDLVKASPDARFMVMIDLNTPYWATHKFHLDSFTDITHAGVMPDWRERTREWMLDFIAYAEKRWGDRIGCYILSGGGTSEWYEYDRGRTSYAKNNGWRGWCRARGLSLGEEPPSPTALGRAAFENLVYDPATEPAKIAYWKFHNSITANAILFFAKAARKAIPKTKEIGVFFGYYLVSPGKHTSFAHLDYERVYASPDIDFFIAPGNYSDRAIGGGSGSQLVHGTALRHGKRFLHEIDFGPHDQNRWGRGLWKTLEDDLAGNTREAAFAMANNASYWWFDMWGGFYRNPEVRERIAALKKVQDALPPAPSVAEILIVCDPQSIYHVNEKSPLELAFGQHLRNNLGRIAAPHDVYSFDDLPVLDMNRYKLVCLNSTLLITPERAKFLREKVCANGRTVLWCYAPGVTDGKTLDAARVKTWAGVPFKTPGISATQMECWRSVYAYDYKLFTPESLTQIASDAGVHLYLDKPATVFANEGFLAVHTKDGGEKTVRLRTKAAKVVDLLTGVAVAEDADCFTARFASPDTRLFGLGWGQSTPGGEPAPLTGKALIRARADASLRGLVRQVETRDRNLGSQHLFTCIYNLLRAGRGLDKIDMLLDVAAELQDRNPESRSYGNFRWYVRDGFVMDYNAVDFCMQAGSLIARDYRDRLTPGQRAKFDKLCELAIKGSLSHHVRSSYTNIALMNAVNLVLLGETYGRRDACDAGVQRLDDFMLNTALCGICEYSSPTYTAVDLSCLHRLHQFARDPGVIDRAERLLRLFWSDVAASSFAGSGRLAGAHSRDYDYLFGLGGMAAYLRAVGLASPLADHAEMPPLPLELSTWRPDAAIRELAVRTPRTIVSKWGEEPDKVRVQWTGRNVTLGTSGANYWNMDIPLAVDFASAKRIPRVYFIADGRRDPYGRKKIPEGNGCHQKTLHLRPFWGGAQRGRDALGLVMYRPGDIPPDTPTLESHIVFPCDVDEAFVNDERVPVVGDAAPFARDIRPGDAVFVRLGAGACAVRVPWARDMRGGSARVALVRDGAAGVRAFRLTVAHHDEWGLQVSGAPAPGAAFWVRVMDDADDPAAFAAFRREFRAAASEAKAESSRAEIAVAGIDGRLSLAVAEPYFTLENVEPRQPDAVLAVDGRDIGLEILGDVPGLAEYRAELERMKREMKANRVFVQKLRPVRWEAEKGAVKPKMEVGKDRTAGGGAYVWTPGEPGDSGSGAGSVSWQLEVKDAGTYRLWGRVFAPTPADDSFIVSANAGPLEKPGARGLAVLQRTDWHLGNSRTWTWREFPVDIALPEGAVTLTLHTREDGAKVDALLLTAETFFQPTE